MTDQKLRPAAEVATDVVRSWNEASYHGVDQLHAREFIEADRREAQAVALEEAAATRWECTSQYLCDRAARIRDGKEPT